MSAKERINERGNKVTTSFLAEGDRYRFDFGLCTADKGWKQCDTRDDAWYFGVWVHLASRRVVTYAEGDIITVDCPTVESFKAELAHMADFYGEPPPAFTVIDAEAGTVTEVFGKRPEVK